ncbi:hypothetical protein HYH03_009742 [Edaphochlamys debaryana]|uniref:Uncharacterized protein n=1 Tax=Edaphochlamys debaryana TaxID=47281 RepID=A0A836BY79_9CHLO|nr:hypothetical protein HYH03_009742 [Edaphochlamys debaryana]|eukprot:KAG2492013.1 hypothetical protein HYH03_009742 [Edaphochlamys debaryana]
MGHYLTSLSQAWATTGTPAFRERLRVMVSELSRVQAALGGGYLSAFPEEHFDRLEALEPVWAPYYVIHKIITGLVDAYDIAGVEEALPMALKAVAYHWNRTQALIAKYGNERWRATLNNEFGGMNEILYRLYGMTKDEDHLAFAKLFDKPVFRRPMELGVDSLGGLHANTHLAQVNGFAMAYDVTGDESARVATRNFFDILISTHSYATGGSNDHEAWFAPSEVSNALWTQRNALQTEETCTQYNILKVARALFRWTGNVSYADFYERALLNGILGTARLPDPAEGEAHHLHLHDHSHHGHDHLHLAGEGHDLPHPIAHLVSSSAASSSASADSRHRQQERSLAEASASATSAAAASQQGTRAQGQARRRAGSRAVFLDSSADGATRDHRMVARHGRQRTEEHRSFPFQGPPLGSNSTNDPGPGVFLYLLPLGSGQSKGDNGHHWGYPLNSFWCCYGTAVESYTKLSDSIFFKDLHPTSGPAESHGASAAAGSSGVALPPRLYVNQFVSSRAAFQEAGLVVTMDADMYAPGPAAVAELRFEALVPSSSEFGDQAGGKAAGGCSFAPASGASGGSSKAGACTFSLMLRIPSWWAPPRTARNPGGAGGAITLTVNGQAWAACPKAPRPGTFCEITREWSPGDALRLRLPMRWWLSAAPENRPEYMGLQAVMMGPFVMAGITHAERQLTLPSAPAEGFASGPDPSGGADPGQVLAARTHPPDDADNKLSLQASWDASLYVRLDKHLLYMSSLEDGGDKMDGTFRAVKSCHRSAPSSGPSAASSAEAGATPRSSTSEADLAAAASSSGLQALLTLLGEARGAGEEDRAASAATESTEAAQQRAQRGDQAAAARGARGFGGHRLVAEAFAALRSFMVTGQTDTGLAIALESMSYPQHFMTFDKSNVIVFTPGSALGAGGCDSAMWVVRPGLDGSRDTVSFESVGRPGWFVSAEACPCSEPCSDAGPSQLCSAAACLDDAHSARVSCRGTCGLCMAACSALHLVQRPLAPAASFRLTSPARRAYPEGSYVLAGDNRHYLLAPLGNIVDERYTAYFDTRRHAAVFGVGAGGWGGGRRREAREEI